MEEVNMMVSGIIRKKDDKYVIVSFQRGEDLAEYKIPAFTLEKNNGFDEGELEQLKIYIKANQADIMEQARKVNPMKALLGF